MSSTDERDITLLHGLNNDRLTWAPVCANLLGVSMPHVPNLPAHKRISDIADEVAAQMPPGLLVGHSFGGAVAMELLHRHPHMVSGLALVTSTLGADTPEQADAREAKARSMDTEQEYVASALAGIPAAFHAAHANLPQVRRERQRSARAYGLDRYRAHCSAIGHRSDRTDAIAAAVARGLPVLVVAAEDDRVIAPARQAQFAARVGAPLAIVATAGHMAPAEQPGALARLLNTWIADQDR